MIREIRFMLRPKVIWRVVLFTLAITAGVVTAGAVTVWLLPLGFVAPGIGALAGVIAAAAVVMPWPASKMLARIVFPRRRRGDCDRAWAKTFEMSWFERLWFN